jgi:circadian clock protein KaiA
LLPHLLVDIYVVSDSVRQRLADSLDKGPFISRWHTSEVDFFSWTGKNRHQIDCIILQSDRNLADILQRLKRQGILLPAVIVAAAPEPAPEQAAAEPGAKPAASAAPAAGDSLPLAQCLLSATDYHPAVACLSFDALNQLEQFIHQAVDRFLQLPATGSSTSEAIATPEDTQHFVLSLQQQRLTEKLKERLGYIGIYFKRNPEHFLRRLSPPERAELLQKLHDDYRVIILKYFSKDATINQKIDDLVNLAFFADVSVSQIVELHMTLMDEFATQLRLEGRSEEILLDYRLTLIDVIAHLCEMYRRSIPQGS